MPNSIETGAVISEIKSENGADAEYGKCGHGMYSRCYAIGEYTTTVSEQRLSKHVPAEMNTHVTIGLLWKRRGFYVVRAKMLRAGQFEATAWRWGRIPPPQPCES
jgi:hypothetical protein